MIPKIIHYCWFGHQPLPPDLQRCINTWHNLLPGYETYCWNESNSPVQSCAFAAAAYRDENWALVSDYVRLWALYRQGGIYLDTDMELLKHLDGFLNQPAFLGAEKPDQLSAGIIGAVPAHPFISRCLDYYKELCYHADYAPLIPQVLNSILTPPCTIDQPLTIQGVQVYPPSYFYPLPYRNRGQDPTLFLTNDSVAIHHWYTSWHSVTDELTNFRYQAALRKVRLSTQRGHPPVWRELFYYGLQLHRVKRKIGQWLGSIVRIAMKCSLLIPLVISYTSPVRRQLAFAHAPTAGTKFFTRAGLRFAVDIGSDAGRRLWYYLYDRGTEQFFAALRQDDQVWEIGSATAYHGLRAARHVSKGGVHIFAEAEVCPTIKLQLRLNKFPHIHVHAWNTPVGGSTALPPALVNWICVSQPDMVAATLTVLKVRILRDRPGLFIVLDDPQLRQQGSSIRAILSWLEANGYRTVLAANGQLLQACYYLEGRRLVVLALPAARHVE